MPASNPTIKSTGTLNYKTITGGRYTASQREEDFNLKQMAAQFDQTEWPWVALL